MTEEERAALEAKKRKNIDLDANLTPEEALEVRRRGGRSSGAAKRRKKSIQQCMKLMMDAGVPPSMTKARNTLKQFGIEDEDMTYATAISAAMIMKAASGNVKAAEFCRDTGGFNPEIVLKKEIFKHEKRMDLIRIGQEDVKKADPSQLIQALESVEIEDEDAES